MTTPPDLDELLAALRHQGIPVAVTEVARLRAAFTAAPELDRDQLRALLRCLLVKKPEQQALFDPLFEAWCPPLDAEWAEDEPEAPPPATTARPRTGRRGETARAEAQAEPAPGDPLRRRLKLVTGAAALVLLALLLTLYLHQPGPDSPPAEKAAQLTPKDRPGSRELPADPVPTVWHWYLADIRVHPPSGLHPAIPGLLALFAALLGLVLWLRYRRRAHPPSAVRDVQPGPEWLPLPGVSGSDTRLLAAREQRDLVWNMALFTSEDQTRRVDEAATVAATVRAGGFTAIHYRHARFPREVWLWLDEFTQDPALTQLADEVCDGLRRNALACRRGSFPGTPRRVWWSRDDHFQPGRLEGHRAHALVALLTDGEGLRHALGSAAQRPRLQTLLRQLRLWPRLVLVDFGDGHALARLVRPYGLEVIAPDQLAAWLGGQPAAPALNQSGAASEPLLGELRLWAAACCLGAEPPDGDTALRIARRLGLQAEPWRLRALYRDAGNARLRWPPVRRRALINWLLRSSPRDALGAPAPGSPARRAIDWWRERLRRASDDERAQHSRLWPWQGTPAEGRRSLERQLLTLYLDPRAAARELRVLARSDEQLRAEIRQRLGGFRAVDQVEPGGEGGGEGGGDGGGDDAIVLGWRLAGQPVLTQDALAELGLGGPRVAGRRGIAPAPSLALALGLIAGLALAAAGAGLKLWLAPPTTILVHRPALLDHDAMAAQTLRLDGGDHWLLGHARAPRRVAAPPGSEVRLDWRWRPTGDPDVKGQPVANNPVRLGDADDALVFRAGTLAQPIRPCIPGWPQRSLAVIEADPGRKAARQLAIRLLDSGTADRVLVTPDWRRRLAAFTGGDELLNRHTRLLVILPRGDAAVAPPGLLRFQAAAVLRADYRELAGWLGLPLRPDAGYQPQPDLAQAPIEVVGRIGAMPWHRGPRQTYDEDTGITWVQVCPGTFTMGSTQAYHDKPDGDPTRAYPDEQPHTVVLSGFEIARTETSNAQYRRWPGPGQQEPPKDHGSGRPGELAAVDLDWQQASDYCAWAGGEGYRGGLPTEAQWEYAARGGSATAWSFGDDAGRLADHAWYSGSSKVKLHPVAGRDPNPLGLFDMHGNAWEWVGDRYGDYAKAPALDPRGPASGGSRVLRGGSFADSPLYLRSAIRGIVGPVSRGRDRGFRCVRVPARQH